jgi:hypothetical protein
LDVRRAVRASLAQALRALAELAAELLPLRPTGVEAGP